MDDKTIQLTIQRIKNTPPPPCEVFQCGHRETCAKFPVACEAFRRYVAGKSVKLSQFKELSTPNNEIYRRMDME